MSSTVFDSALFRDMFGTAEMRGVFSDKALIERYIEVEVALARAEARCGVIPADAAEQIAALSQYEALDLALMQHETEIVGYVRGLHEKLDTILAQHPNTEPFISKVRGLLKGFRLDELNRTLKEAEDECTHPQH